MTIAPEELVGTWALVDWRIEYLDGRVTRPFGVDAAGQLVYSADGHMSASVSRAGRSRLDAANARLASVADKAAAFDGYFHYAGRWHLDGNTVVHSVDLALNPDFVGSEQRRRVDFDGAQDLQLSADEPVGERGARRHVLAWRRVADRPR